MAVWPAFGERQLERAIPLSLAGGSIAVATTGLLSVVDLLQGPNLLPWGGAALESLYAAALGGLIGVLPAASTRLGAKER